MRSTTFLLACLTIAAFAAPALAGPVNPVANGDFELYAPLGAALLEGTPVDGQGVGVGRQLLGCTHTANVVWEEDCRGQARDRATEVEAIASDPGSEVEAWTAPGYRQGDLVIVAPQDQGVWYAANWVQYPPGTISFGDADADGDREARILPGNAMLYQSFASASPHTALPAGLIRTVTADLEAGAPAGSLVFVLDSFPLESAFDWPQAFINYQLYMPAGTWSVQDGAVTIDPLQGSLSDPARGGWILERDTHPTAAQWNAASPEERRAILMELRVTQMTFWNLAPGTQIDNVAWDLNV